MKCPKCGEELPATSLLCPKCGTFLPEPRPEKPSAKLQPKPAYVAAGVLLAVILGAVLMRTLFGHSVTSAPQPSGSAGPSVTNAPPPGVVGGPSVTNAPPPVPQPSAAPAKAAAPQDVLDYLKFVEETEKARQALLRDTSRALAMTTSAGGIEKMLDWVMDESDQADPLSDLKKELGIQAQNWQALLRQFDSRPAPPAAADFGGAYRAAVASEAYAMGRVRTVVNDINVSSKESMQQALSGLQQMKSDPNTQGNIDKAVELADAKLGELSNRIGIEKPFKVKKETEVSGSITGGF